MKPWISRDCVRTKLVYANLELHLCLILGTGALSLCFYTVAVATKGVVL